jgi:hypothetical protein
MLLGLAPCTLADGAPDPAHHTRPGDGDPAAEAGDGRISGFGYSAPFEDLRLK